MQIIRAFSVPFLVLALLSLFGGTARADKAETLTVDAARAFIKKQVEAIKSGDVAAVKAGLTARQKDKVTAEMLVKAKEQASKLTLEELVDKVEASGKIKMKNGRTLTTLVNQGGTWLADTLWFK